MTRKNFKPYFLPDTRSKAIGDLPSGGRVPKATPSLPVSRRGVGRWGNRGESEYVAVVLKRQAL